MKSSIALVGLSILLAGCGRKEKPSVQAATGPASPPPPAASDTPAQDEFKAKVMRVVDGDTIKVVDRDFQTLSVQFRGVDAPELKQEYGQEAFAALEKRLKDKVVRVVVDRRDEFDRITGEVFESDESINVWIIRQGFGWYNHKYDTDRKKSAAEVSAREAGRGLWVSATPIPPWVWKNPPDDGRLYVQGNGTCYHCAACETLDGRRTAISLEDALKNYKPCGRCKPPTE